MTIALAAPVTGVDRLPSADGLRLTVRAAPRREPPFDDEMAARHLHAVGPLDRPLPFARPAPRQVMTAAGSLRREVPDPAVWGRRLLVGIIEAAGGKRPLQQLVTLLSPSIAHGLRADFERAAQDRRRHWTHAATVRSIRASEPSEGVAEVCATVQIGGRVRAVAFRAETHQGKWRCTRLQIG
jgi:hypothetical protein